MLAELTLLLNSCAELTGENNRVSNKENLTQRTKTQLSILTHTNTLTHTPLKKKHIKIKGQHTLTNLNKIHYTYPHSNAAEE